MVNFNRLVEPGTCGSHGNDTIFSFFASQVRRPTVSAANSSLNANLDAGLVDLHDRRATDRQPTVCL